MMQKVCKAVCLTALLSALCAVDGVAQTVNLKTNALYWGTLTPNIGVETRLGGKWSGQMFVGYNPWNRDDDSGPFGTDRRLRHILVQPEVRYWTCVPYLGHFFGLHLIYSHYNVGNWHLPFREFSKLKDYRYEGDLGAIGIGYGYSWMLSRNWSIEAEAGIGVGYTRFKKYNCEHCGTYIGPDEKLMVMPTKLAVNVIWNVSPIFDRKKTSMASPFDVAENIATSTTVAAPADTSLLSINDSVATLQMLMTVGKGEKSRNFAHHLTPFIEGADGNKMYLNPVTFRSVRNRKYMDRERRYGTQPQAAWEEYVAGDTMLYKAVITRDSVPWLWNEKDVKLRLYRERESCCDLDTMPTQDLCTARYTAPVVEEPPITDIDSIFEKHKGFLTTFDDYNKKTDALRYVHFELDSIALKHWFMDNGPRLDSIISLTRELLNMPDVAVLRKIQIRGQASIEGTYAHNCYLAENRAAALQQYVQREFNLPDSLFERDVHCEGWDELKEQILADPQPWSQAAIDIIDGEPNPDRREWRLRRMQGGRPWKYIAKNMLPYQRNSGYMRIYIDLLVAKGTDGKWHYKKDMKEYKRDTEQGRD